jgi:catalase
VWDETQKLAGKDPDFNRRDLWNAIEMGNFPEFELGIQVVEEEDEFAFDFDLLDPTKFIPEELVPVRLVGKMVLNRNPDNFFAETEQVAFHPGHVVNGIDFTNDPLLQGRLFSYLDTQLIRLGGPNFAELPINRPVAPVHNNQRDGFMRQTINKGRTNYFPNSLGDGCPMTAPENMRGYVHYAEKVDGRKIRDRSESFKDFFSQAKLFWNSQTEAEKMHLLSAFHFELGKVESMEVRQRMVDMVSHIDEDLAQEVAKGIGIKGISKDREKVAGDAVKPKKGKRSVDHSPALSMENTRKDTIKGRKIAILAAEGIDSESLMQIKQAIENEGAQIEVVSRFLGVIPGVGGKEIKIDKNYVTTGSIMYDAVFVPGGMDGVQMLKKQGDALHFINEAFKHCKAVAAYGEGVDLLADAHLIGVELAGTNQEHGVRTDKGVVTSRNSALEPFIQEFIKAIAMHRHWERETIKDQVPA